MIFFNRRFANRRYPSVNSFYSPGRLCYVSIAMLYRDEYSDMYLPKSVSRLARRLTQIYRSRYGPSGVRSGLRYRFPRLVRDQSFLDMVKMGGNEGLGLNFTTFSEHFYTWLPTLDSFPEPQMKLEISVGFAVTPVVLDFLICYLTSFRIASSVLCMIVLS